MKDQSDSFLGRGWAFPPYFNLDRGTVEMVDEEEDIRQSIQIIINTIPGERMMFPDFGCGIRSFVFESNDPTYTTMLKDTIYDALLFHEPRIKDINIEIENNDIRIAPHSDGYLFIHITYHVIITNTRNNIVIPFYKNEGTIL
ncbi:MAG TPA: GPW/gp25 family protein [Eudoraea sp.]|nr:GPW/gp25 family protein [Eudoraea sp.]